MIVCFSFISVNSFGSCEKANRDFYVAYMQNAENNPEANIALKQACMSPELIVKIEQVTERTDADAVIMAQDVSKHGIQSLTVEPLKDNWYMVKYKFNTNSDYIEIEVQACNCDSDFRISDISYPGADTEVNSLIHKQ